MFSSTSGACYLFKADDSLSEKVDVWVIWESTVLLVCIFVIFDGLYVIRKVNRCFSFQPALAASNFDKIADSPVLDLINHVDKALGSNLYLVGVSILIILIDISVLERDLISLCFSITQQRLTVADVILWSSLFALLTEKNIVSQYLSSKHSILKWFDNLKDSTPVKVKFSFINLYESFSNELPTLITSFPGIHCYLGPETGHRSI